MTWLEYLNAQQMNEAEFARLIPCSRMTAWRYARGMRDVPAPVSERIREITGGLVTPLDLHETRLGWLRDHGQWPPAEAARAA